MNVRADPGRSHEPWAAAVARVSLAVLDRPVVRRVLGVSRQSSKPKRYVP